MPPVRRLLIASLAALVAGGLPARAAEFACCLPDRPEAVVSLNVKQLLHAPAFKTYALGAIKQALRDDPRAREYLEALGLNVFKDVHRITLAGCGGDEKTAYALAVVRGRFDTARFQALARKLIEADGERFQAYTRNGLECYRVVGSRKKGSVMLGSGVSDRGPTFNFKSTGSLLDMTGTLHVALADKNTLLVATSEEGLADACDKARGKKRAILGKDVRRVIEGQGPQTLVGVFTPSAAAKAQGEGAGEEQEDKDPGPVERLTAAVSVGDGLDVRVVLTATGVDGARELMKGCDDLRARVCGMAALLAGTQKKYAFLTEVPRTFKATRKGRTVRVEGRIDADLLDRLATLLHRPD